MSFTIILCWYMGILFKKCAKNFFHLHLHRTPRILFIVVVPNMAAYGCQLPQ
jgi:hypothetical protein